jgi:RNA polymerase sigma-70 factor (ECF subfamily)
VIADARTDSPENESRAVAPSFDEVFAETHGRVLGLCLHLTGNRADAEDAAQETYLSVTKALKRFRGDSRVSTWVYRIAIRAALRVKARRPSTEPLQFEPAVEARNPAIDRERSRLLRRALARLSFEHRTVLALFSLDGLSHREIAETLGIPEGTVWSRLHLARKNLSVELKALGFEMAT